MGGGRLLALGAGFQPYLYTSTPPLQEKWVEVAPMSTARAGVSVSAVNGFLYAIGGRAASRDFSAPVTVDSVEIYDPHLDTWTEVGNMITSRCDGGLAVL